MAKIIAETLDAEGFDERNLKMCCPWHNEDHASCVWNHKELKYHCFSGDTKVITSEGVKQISEIVGKDVDLINGNGAWETTRFFPCGEQEVYKIVLSRKKKEKEIYATKEHEWLRARCLKRYTTIDLLPGNRLQYVIPKRVYEIAPNTDGLVHGFMYGDGTKVGTVCDGTVNVYRANICTEEKLDFVTNYISDIVAPSPSMNRCIIASARAKTVRDYKSVPDLTESLSYLLGFLSGYFVADGNCSDETVLFSSVKYDDLDKIKNICTLLGIATYPIGKTVRSSKSNLGIIKNVPENKEYPIYTLRVSKATLPESFFITKKRLKEDIKISGQLCYTVKSVQKTGLIVPVYCCETSTHSFALEDFILTGNCFGACGRNYDIIDAFIKTGMTYIEAVQKLFDIAKIKYSFGEHKIQSKTQYKYPKEVPLNDKKAAYEYLNLRGISPATADHLDIRESDGNLVFNYYDTSDVLTMVKYRPARKINKGENKNWCQAGADTTPLLYNMNRINCSEPLAIFSGELDCAAAIEAGWTNSVSIPLGDQNTHWVAECWEFLEQFESIIICPDNDESGKKYCKDIVPRLGSWRCSVMEIPEDCKDANEVLYRHGKETLLQLILNAKASPVDSVIDYSDITNLDVDEIDGIKTGIKSLDNKLMRLFYGTFNIVTGINGSGKSSFLSSLTCNALDDDKNVFMYSGELPNFQAKNWINYIFAGQRNVKRYEKDGSSFWKITKDSQKQIDEYYKGKLYIYKDGFDHKSSSILKAMEDTCRRYGCKLFIIDNLTSVNLECNENNKYQKQEEFTAELIDFAKKYNVCVIMVIHPHKIETMRRLTKMDVQGISALIDLAHRIISLYRVSAEDKAGVMKQKGNGWFKEPIKYDVLCDVLKDRMLGYEGISVGLYYDKPSRRFFEGEVDLDRKYKWDTQEYKGSLPYPPKQLEEEKEIFG